MRAGNREDSGQADFSAAQEEASNWAAGKPRLEGVERRGSDAPIGASGAAGCSDGMSGGASMGDGRGGSGSGGGARFAGDGGAAGWAGSTGWVCGVAVPA